MPPKKKVSRQRGRLVRNLNDLYQDEALGSGMMRRVSRSPSVVPSGSSGATGRKSAPSPVATEEEEEEEEEEEHEVQQQDDEVQGREEGEEEEEDEE
jgi:ribosomal protein L12E/L44/L45/RPP1/RPP2